MPGPSRELHAFACSRNDKEQISFPSAAILTAQIPSDRARTVMTSNLLTPNDFRDPAIILSGTVDYAMYKEFRERLASASSQRLVVVELSTLGGDPEVARMMGEDVRYHSDLQPERHFVFLGKAAI